MSVRGRGARAEVAYTLVNRGNVVLVPELALHAEGILGPLPGRGPRALPVELLPGRRVRLTEPWPGAPVLDGVDLTLTVTAPGAAPATATASAWFAPRGTAARTGAGLIALGGLALAARRLVRARRPRRPRHDPPPHGAPVPASAGRQAPDHDLAGAST